MSRKRSSLASHVFLAAFLVGLLSPFLCTAVVKAQSPTTGAFKGWVVDSQTDAPVDNALVEITNVVTGYTHRVRTTSRGEFLQGLLPPGVYTIAISRAGYKDWVKRHDLYATQINIVAPTPIKLERDTAHRPTISSPTPAAVTRDTVPPSIQITSPQVSRAVGVSVNTSKVMVTGQAVDPSGVNEVTVQDVPARLDEDGNFSAEVLLKVGENKITVTAIDIYGNKATEDFTLRRTVLVGPADISPVPMPEPGRYYALVIGNNAYQDLPRLKTAVNDAKEVDAVLRGRYGFETKLLLDAKRKEIIQALNEYRRKLEPNANLLIYYAGHGYRDPETDKAYWLPVDANRDDNSDWISADDVTTNVRGIPARHILVISDSCYSGTLSRASSMRLSSRYIQKLIESKSRTLMASGGNEPVTDGGGGGNHSVFANALLRGLDEMEDDVFTAEDLFHHFIREPVAGKSNQLPEYSTLRASGHEGGDFVFVRKK